MSIVLPSKTAPYPPKQAKNRFELGYPRLLGTPVLKLILFVFSNNGSAVIRDPFSQNSEAKIFGSPPFTHGGFTVVLRLKISEILH